ncbi:hypothetical protein H101_07878, partial [Trichophyton interdigitale H6]
RRHLKDVTSLRTYNLHILPCKQQQQQQDREKEGPSYLVAVKICSFRVAFDLRSNHGQVETLFVFGRAFFRLLLQPQIKKQERSQLYGAVRRRRDSQSHVVGCPFTLQSAFLPTKRKKHRDQAIEIFAVLQNRPAFRNPLIPIPIPPFHRMVYL